MQRFQQETIAATETVLPQNRTVSTSLRDAPQENATAAADLLLETAANAAQTRRTEARFYGFLGVTMRREARQIAAAALLPFSDDPRFLLPLIDSLNTPQTPEWKKEAYPVLTERLWNLSPTDAILSLDETRRVALRSALADLPFATSKTGTAAASRFDDVTTDFAVALMKTLAGMGDKKSVPVFQKIIKTKGNTANETVVRDAAREYLTVLTQKQIKNNKIQQKLRTCLGEAIRDPQTVLAEFLETLAPDETKAVLVTFIREQQRATARLGVYLGGGCAILGTAPLITIYLSGFRTSGTVSPTIFGFCFLIMGVYIAYLPTSLGSIGTEGVKMVAELAKSSGNDTRLLSLLLQTARSGLDKKQDDAMKKALVRLLPLLKPGDAALVPPAQRAYLRSWLKMPRPKKKQKSAATGSSSQTLTIVALDALAAVGDTRALPAAEAIAQRTVKGTYRETELHEAAVCCVEALRARNPQ